MRSRTIKPEFFDSDELAQCEPLARLLYIGLWCLADREGRFKWRPAKIKKCILGYDDADIDALLTQLSRQNHVIRYEIDGEHYGIIPSFDAHQNVHPKEKSSIIPAPPDDLTHLPFNSVKLHGVQVDGRSRSRSNIDKDVDAKFDAFWSAYPRKVNKKVARRKFLKLAPNDTLFKIIMDALERHKKSKQWKKDGGQFVPHPSTWINQERWEDEVEVENPKGFIS